MLRKLGLAIAASLLAIWPTAGSAKDHSLQPSTGWLMDYAPDSCRLMRAFGTGSDQVIAQLIRYQPSDRIEFNLVGAPLANLQDVNFVRVRFGTAGEFVRVRAFPGAANDSHALFLAVRLDNSPAEGSAHEMGEMTDSLRNPRRWLLVDDDNGPSIAPEIETKISTVTVDLGRRTLALELNELAKPMAALRKCTQDLVHEWGLDADQQAALASPPTPVEDPSSWLMATYTSQLAIDSERAMVRFRLMIDEQGKPKSCTVQAGIEISQHFSKPGCAALMRYGRFRPARTRDGQAAASFYSLRAVWFMPPTAIERRLFIH